MIKIFIATHKKANLPSNEIYQPIQVGTILNAERFLECNFHDDVCDNISDKNKSFCELTAVYWIWKNDNSDIVGLTHYRRYFVTHKKGTLNEILIKKSDVTDILQAYDIILPKKELLDASAGHDYSQFHYEKDLLELRNVIKKMYPDYVQEYDSFLKQNKMSKYNMLICKKTLWNQYCEWLFNILFELEKRTDITEYSPQQKRIYGYLSERLLNVWVAYNKLSVKYMNVLNTEESTVDKLKGIAYKIARYVFHIDVYEYQLHRKFKFFQETWNV